MRAHDDSLFPTIELPSTWQYRHCGLLRHDTPEFGRAHSITARIALKHQVANLMESSPNDCDERADAGYCNAQTVRKNQMSVGARSRSATPIAELTPLSRSGIPGLA